MLRLPGTLSQRRIDPRRRAQRQIHGGRLDRVWRGGRGPRLGPASVSRLLDDRTSLWGVLGFEMVDKRRDEVYFYQGDDSSRIPFEVRTRCVEKVVQLCMDPWPHVVRHRVVRQSFSYRSCAWMRQQTDPPERTLSSSLLVLRRPWKCSSTQSVLSGNACVSGRRLCLGWKEFIQRKATMNNSWDSDMAEAILRPTPRIRLHERQALLRCDSRYGPASVRRRRH